MLYLDPQTPRIIVPLFARSLADLETQAGAAQASADADLAELRLDPLRQGDWLPALALTRKLVQKPLIVTIRTAREGGEAAIDPNTYRDACLALLAQGGVDALDIEWRHDAALVRALRDGAKRAGAAALFSEHHFDGTPDTHAMVEALHGMLDAGADIAKLAVMPHSRADAARLLLATAEVHDARPQAPLITMSMGALGAVTRFCGGAFGSGATFGTLSAASAPGQPRAAELKAKLEAEPGRNEMEE